MKILNNKKKGAKNQINKKIKKVIFNLIKPFLPFIIVIIGIVFAVCTVVDSLFSTEDDMAVAEQLSNSDYEAQYAEWLKVKQTDGTTLPTVSSGDGLVSKGMFTWPIPGYTQVSSKFGMRTHPITGVYKLHSGTDISAPMGVNFVAMADGTVIKAGFNTAYGNMVMIDHRSRSCYSICSW